MSDLLDRVSGIHHPDGPGPYSGVVRCVDCEQVWPCRTYEAAVEWMAEDTAGSKSTPVEQARTTTRLMPGWPSRTNPAMNDYQISASDEVYNYADDEAVVEAWDQYSSGASSHDFNSSEAFVAAWKAAYCRLAQSWTEEWRVTTVLGGMEHQYTFTEFDTMRPEKAARDLAAALAPISDYARITRRLIASTDWEVAP